MKTFLATFAMMGALALALTGCPKNPVPTPVPPTPDADASMPPGPPSCATACARARQLGCDWSRPTLNGVSCETVCSNANRVDGPIRWNFVCRTSETSCAPTPPCQ